MFDLLEKLIHPSVIWVLIPITAIIGGLYYDLQKKRYEVLGENPLLSPDDIEAINQMARTNQKLAERVENIETIITSIDPDLLALKGSDESEANTRKIQALSQRIKEQSDS